MSPSNSKWGRTDKQSSWWPCETSDSLVQLNVKVRQPRKKTPKTLVKYERSKAPSWQSSWQWSWVLNYLFNLFQSQPSGTDTRTVQVSVGEGPCVAREVLPNCFPRQMFSPAPKHSTFLQVWNYLDLIFHTVCLAEHDSWWGAGLGTNSAHGSLNTLNFPGRSGISLYTL